MSRSRWARARRRGLAAVAGAGMVAATLSTAGAAGAAPPDVTPSAAEGQTFEAGRYIVVMRDEPVAAYDGGVQGLAETEPAPGTPYRPGSPEAKAYRSHLKAQQKQARQDAGVDRVVYEYTDTISGFAADLSAGEATALAKDSRVLAVVPDELRQLDTNASPEFLGLTGSGGVWDRLGGLKQPRGAGAGVVVGIIDSGIWPENPSFDDGRGWRVPNDWNGECESENDTAGDQFCNNKLIGARYFVEGFGAGNLADYEFLSPRDADGHGTHTAATAAGNDGVNAVIDGRDFGEVSGMAPEAYIAAYKVCWDGKTGGGCYSSDSAAAIDAAIRDGVDVLNFSISGTSSNYLDPVELAFMSAANAGIFVAASSGNSGPTASTTNHPSPWLTTVAASTHTIKEQTLVTGDGQRFIGASITEPLETETPMVLSDTIPAAGETAERAALCYPGSLDPAGAAGKIVVCDRGVIARVDKSTAVEQAGGVGMVLVNTSPSSLDTDLHAVPTVHLAHTYRDQVRAYVSGTADPTGRILPTNEGSTTQVPEVAGFSSRGPSRGADGDILKPDISAPGVGVLAAYSPRSAGRDFDFLSGTSMSSPHIAGLGALIKDAHPTWSPMAIKSAMMTTARDHASEASNDVFASGAGFVEPRRFLDPGLVYDSSLTDWFAFLAGQGVTYSDGTPVSNTPIDASDLNQASIAIGSLAGKQTVERTVTNVSKKRATWRASVDGLDGLDVKVEPSVLTLRPGQSATYTVTFTATPQSAFGSYAQGYLTWQGTTESASTVRSPVAVRPVAVAAPDEVHADAGADSITIDVTSGFAGTMTTAVKGLAPGTVTGASAQNTGGGDFTAGDPRNHTQELTVPEGTTLTRVELVPGNPNDDLDLFITEVGGTRPLLSSASGTAAERITTTKLAPGTYTVHVQAWGVERGAESTTFDVREFLVGDADAGNLVLDPSSAEVTPGQQVTFTGALTVDDATPYLGWVRFSNGAEEAGRTIVSVG